MSKFKRARVNIVGTKPLLWHRFSEESISLIRKEKTGVAGNDPQEWEKGVLVTDVGQLYLEPSYIFGCLRNAATYTKGSRGKGSIQKQLSSTLQVLDDIILIKDRFLPPPAKLKKDPADPVYLDVRSVRNPSTSGRNIRYRIAVSKGWKAEFNIMWDPTIVDSNLLRAVLNDAGSLVGLGDGRSIGFGRFSIEECSIVDVAKI